jgi:hypothetical protein
MFGNKKTATTVNLGDTARDKITGLTGTVVAITEWLHSCKRVTIQSTELRDGKPLDNQTFDGPQMELVKKAGYYEPEARKTGGPSITPSRSKDPE